MTGEGSSLLLDELLDAGDERALPELLASKQQKKLAHLAHRLFTQKTNFARKLLLAYVDDGCDRPGHRAFVKTLFKAAEEGADRELMAHFAVAFDRLVRRTQFTEWRYDWSTRQSTQQTVLRDPTSFPRRLPRTRYGEKTYTNPVTGVQTRIRRAHVPVRPPRRRYGRNPASGRWEYFREQKHTVGDDPLVFSLSTRRYLQRRTWRFFRVLAKTSPAEYRAAVLPLLTAYEDAHLSSPEALLDSWTLMHVLYHGSAVLDRHPLGIRVTAGRSMKELTFEPFCAGAWKGCLDELMSLALHARSRTVRQFALWALTTNHGDALAGMPVRRLAPFLKSPHEELQNFAATALAQAQGLDALPIAEWLVLLKLENPIALGQLCELVKKHVAPSRLTLEQCVELACARPAPVAELGLAWAKEKQIYGLTELEVILKLRHAEAPGVRERGVEWVAQLLLLNDASKPVFVRELLDAKHVDVRRTAMELMQKDSRFGEAVELWLAMSETPYADVRDRFVDELGRREKTFGPSTLQRVWATTLLSVHRGSRAKAKAAKQVAERVVKQPHEAGALLTLLAHTLRSVRAPERRAALTQLTRAATRDRTLQAALKQKLPELELVGEEASE